MNLGIYVNDNLKLKLHFKDLTKEGEFVKGKASMRDIAKSVSRKQKAALRLTTEQILMNYSVHEEVPLSNSTLTSFCKYPKNHEFRYE